MRYVCTPTTTRASNKTPPPERHRSQQHHSTAPHQVRARASNGARATRVASLFLPRPPGDLAGRSRHRCGVAASDYYTTTTIPLNYVTNVILLLFHRYTTTILRLPRPPGHLAGGAGHRCDVAVGDYYTTTTILRYTTILLADSRLLVDYASRPSFFPRPPPHVAGSSALWRSISLV